MRGAQRKKPEGEGEREKDPFSWRKIAGCLGLGRRYIGVYSEGEGGGAFSGGGVLFRWCFSGEKGGAFTGGQDRGERRV